MAAADLLDAGGGRVIDPISLSAIPAGRAIRLDTQWYDANSLAAAARRGMRFVPHSRRRLLPRELRAIADLAQVSAATLLLLDDLVAGLRVGQSLQYDLPGGLVLLYRKARGLALYHTVDTEQLEVLSEHLSRAVAVDTLRDLQSVYPLNLSAGHLIP